MKHVRAAPSAVPATRRNRHCWRHAACQIILAPQSGPDGCGKALLVRHCVDRLRKLPGGTAVAEVHCSAGTGAAQIIEQLVLVR